MIGMNLCSKAPLLVSCGRPSDPQSWLEEKARTNTGCPPSAPGAMQCEEVRCSGSSPAGWKILV